MRFDAVSILFLLSLVILAGAHHSAMAFSLYFVYPWFDVPMRLLGGITVALGLHMPLCARIMRVKPHTYLMTIIGVMAIGVVWEVFEWQVGIIDSARYIPDTALDLLLDFIGGTLGYVLARYANYDS